MIKDSAVRTFITAVTLVFAINGQAYALTVYDLIKLSSKDYSNQDIVTLIEVTESAFSLKAEDIPRLKDLGVSETVIQAMLKAKHIGTQSNTAVNPVQIKPNGKNHVVHVDATKKVAKPAGTESLYSASNKAINRNNFNAELFKEAAAKGHSHRVITLGGLRLFVLRDEGQYASIEVRGNTVVNQLKQATSFGSGTFKVAHISGKDAVIFSGRYGTHSIVIVSVSAEDAYTYQLRSGRQVTTELLAAYWSALLSDYWSILIANQPPARLLGLYDGAALQVLYDRWVASSASDDYSKLTMTLLSLSNQQREHLLRLATWMPRDFNNRLSITKHP